MARIDGWLFRWSAANHLRCFVGDTPACAAECLCEIIAARNLREALGVQDGDVVVIDAGPSFKWLDEADGP